MPDKTTAANIQMISFLINPPLGRPSRLGRAASDIVNLRQQHQRWIGKTDTQTDPAAHPFQGLPPGLVLPVCLAERRAGPTGRSAATPRRWWLTGFPSR